MQPKQAITFIVPEFPPLEGGVGSYLYEIIRNINQCDLTVIAPASNGWKDFDLNQTFKVRRVRLPNIKSFPFAAQLATMAPIWGYFREVMRIPKSNVVVCASAHPIHMLLSWILKTVKGNKFIVINYGLDILFPQKRFYRGLFNHLLLSADYVVTISEATANLNRKIKVKTSKLEIIYPPMNFSKFDNNFSKAKVIEKYNLSGKRCILSVGRLIERKGVDTVIRALPEIIKSIPDVHYIVVGRGRDEVKLKKLVSEMNLQDYVSFTGYVPDRELGVYYCVSEVFSMISRELHDKGDIEGFGIVFLEANYFGIPVVGGNSGGVTDAVIHGKTGLLVDPENVIDVAEAIIKLLLDKDLSNTLGAYGRTRVLKEFTGGQAANQLLKIIQKL